MARANTTPTTDGSRPPKRGDIESVDTGGQLDRGEVTLVGHDLRYYVWVKSTPGGPEVGELKIINDSFRPITAEDLRSIPLRRMARAVARAAGKLTWNDVDPNLTAKDLERSGITANDWTTPDTEPRPGRPPIDSQHLQEVAALARDAFRRGWPVRQAIADRFQVSIWTVDNWLRKCREQGLLEPNELRKRKTKKDQ